MTSKEFDPDVAPSGKPSLGYGEIMIRVWFTGPEEDKYKSSEVAISGPEGMPYPYWKVANAQLGVIAKKKEPAPENTGI